jgi:hypothetical protein
MQFIANYNLTGILIGLGTFLIIGIFHPIVIKSEYYFGVRCWWVFLGLGLAGIACSLLINDLLWSSLISVFSFSCFWSILELFHQRNRVRKGWFPKRERKGGSC